MNLSMEGKKYIDSVLEERCLSWLFPPLETGQATCKQLFAINNKFFDCTEYLNSVPGHLLSYSISKQVKEQSKLPLFPFELHNEIINNRNGYTIPVLKRDDITITLLRSPKRFVIDSNDKLYLKQKCLNNNQLNSQMYIPDEFFDEFTNQNSFLYHGVLLYGAVKYWEGINFADIVFFDSDLKAYHHSINLLEKLHIHESTMTSEQKQKSILSAQNIIKEFINQSEG